jgi:hypothetical protein
MRYLRKCKLRNLVEKILSVITHLNSIINSSTNSELRVIMIEDKIFLTILSIFRVILTILN